MKHKQQVDEILKQHAIVVQCNKVAEEKGNQAVQAAIECGKILIAVKKSVKHGEWLPWLAENCTEICEKTAENYMRLANPKHVADLSDCLSLRQAYIKISGDKPKSDAKKKSKNHEPNEYEQCKGMAVNLWNLLTTTTKPDLMAEEIEPILKWHRNYLDTKLKREAALNDEFEMKVSEETTAEKKVQFECVSCGETFDDDSEAVALYECNNCGTTFTRETSANENHQCPDCNKFGAKISDCGCPSCNEAELSEAEVEPDLAEVKTI